MKSDTFPAPDPLSDSQFEELAAQLALEQERLRQSIKTLEPQLTARQDCSIHDAVEAAGLREQADRAAALMQGFMHTLAEVESALERMASGSYGISEATGDPISYDRLRLVPWARTGVND